MLLLEKIYKYQKEQPNKVAIISENGEITYREFYENICRCAYLINQKKITRGDIIIYENTQDEFFCYLFFAVNLLKCINLAVDSNTPPNRIAQIRKNIGSSVVISVEEIKEKFNLEVPLYEYEESEENDTCLLLLSSGSTGTEKIIEYKNSTVFHVAKIYDRLYNLNDSVMVLITGPICRAYSITRMFVAFYYGLTLYIYNSQNITDLVDILDSYKNIMLCTNPTIIHYLLALFYDQFKLSMKNIKIIESCTAPLSINDSKQVVEILGDTSFYNFYGATELQVACLDIKKYGHEKGCVGKPIEDVLIEILDKKGKVISPESNKDGVVRISNSEYGYQYYGQDEQKYFFPGEIGYLKDGLLYLVDREKSFFNIDGYKISPVEVEGVALSYNYVLECVCYYNKVLSLDIMVKDGFDIEKLKKVLSENLSRYQIPKRINVVKQLLKTSNGKINRKLYNKK